MDGLPEDSRVRSAPIDGWTKQTELLAQLIEEVSILAADRRREEPTSVPRPYKPAGAARERSGSPPQQPAGFAGHRAMLAAAMQRGMVRSV
ncbi:hypothetical protein [Streptomyces sp. bgisy060]|uniref:hypothetical protein n=1 Tax=Streptomyces sp. bgisy060 TaxID=3413775 RepID=UPI003EB70B43